jgi:hypothetical protein
VMSAKPSTMPHQPNFCSVVLIEVLSPKHL